VPSTLTTSWWKNSIFCLIDLFLQLCLHNNGRLSVKKRAAHFGFLTDDELADMENAVREG
jgi:hypothetical protein